MTSLITPDLVEQAILEVLQQRHPEHLAQLERQLDLEPETIERVQTFRVVDDDDLRESGESLPWLGLGINGFADEPARTQTTDNRVTLTIAWRVLVDIDVFGKSTTDAMQRARWTGMTVAECFYQRVPRQSEPIESVTLVDMQFSTEGGVGSTLARCAMVFTVRVSDSLTVINQALGSNNPPGTPGGPPTDPYDVPAIYPTADVLDVTLDRKNAAEPV